MQVENPRVLKPRRLNKNFGVAAGLLLLSLALLVYLDVTQIMPIKKLDVPNLDNDLSVFWTGSRTVLQGGNPYLHDEGSLFLHIAREAGGYSDVYLSPFYVSLLFMPLTPFPINIAAGIWLVLIQILLGASVVLLIRLAGQTLRPGVLLTGLALAVFWRYSFEVMILDNLSLVMLFAIVLSFYYSRTERPFLAGVVAAFLLLKPQIVFLTLPLLLVVPTAPKNEPEGKTGWLNRATGQRLAGFGLVSAVFALYSFSVFPGWVGEWLKSAGGRYTPEFDSEMASVRSIAALLAPESKYVPVIYLVLAAGGGLIWLVYWWANRNDARNFPYLLSITIGANLLIAPYTRSYDFCMLLVPLIFGYFKLRQAEIETIKSSGKEGFRWTWLWWLLIIVPWPLHWLAINTTFAWENLVPATMIGVTLLVQNSKYRAVPNQRGIEKR